MNRKPFLVALAELLSAYRPHFNLARSRWLHGWLPSRGNVIFTLIIAGLLVLAQSAGALPVGRPQAAPSAASTGTIAYQGRLADANGSPLTDTYNMIFRLYDATAGGTPLWAEQWTGSNGVKVSDGLFNVMLGSLTAMPQSVIAGRDQVFLGITVGTDDEMLPRVQLGSVPFAVQALTVPDGSVTMAKIADGAVTRAKLDSTSWADLPLNAGFHSPPEETWQKAQYRRIGDIVYLRGTITKDALANIIDADVVAFLPADLHPVRKLAFPAESHAGLQTKHRVDIWPDGTVMVADTAGATPHVSLDGILFSIGQ